jgi:hypothetical protein
MSRSDRIRASAQAYGLRGPSSKGEFQVNCPECINRVGKEDTSFKLQCNPNAYNKRTGEYGPFFFCYRCSWAGSCDLSWLGEVELPKPDPNEIPEWSQPPEGFEVLTESSYALKPFVDYLQGRKVWEQAQHIGVGACTTGKYAGRVILPCKKADGSWWGFSARIVGKRIPKYLYPVAMARGTSLWGQDWLPRLKDKASPIYLTEGVLDAMPLYPYGLASFGKNVTDAQVDLLVSFNRPVTVALDGDAHVDAQVLCRRLQARGVDARWCKLPPTTDPGTLGWKIRDYIVTPP